MIVPGRHGPFYAAALCGMTALVPAVWFKPELAVQVGANVFFLVYLTLEWFKLPKLTPAFLKKHAASADEPAWVIILITFGAVVVAVGSLFMILNEQDGPKTLDVTLALLSVALGWFTIHTMAALHYAHIYWRPEVNAKAKPMAGLDFPGDDEPSGYDFLYFSFVIGMTAQTSDVEITQTRVRKLNTVHAVASFFFNTVLVAAAVNLAVSLAN
ncbi:DUF1345 domain-containing protein [Corticibacterium sp. UT-5YL-CI-8]|nr:DUF1345 domain-containing protein [Tianweitania sp. UT-5YL-CI-8]